jgi:hypothetical protein
MVVGGLEDSRMARRSARQELLAPWFALSDAERVFLRRAAEWDKLLPHSEGFSRVIPLMDWREIGASCGFSERASDELAQALAAKKIILLSDPSQYTFGLLAGHLVNEVDAAARKRRWRGIEFVVVAVTVLVTLLYLTLKRAA